MSIHPLISTRRSIRAFADREVSADELHALFDAARWAASAFNEQPWRFIVARKNEAGFQEMCSCLNEWNRNWAKHASFLVLAMTKQTLTQTGKPNRHASHDLGLAIGNLSTQATASGIYLHQMAGFDVQQAIEVFNLPADFEPVTIIAGGYPGDLSLLNEDLQKRETAERTRKQLDELVFSGKFGTSHPLFEAKH
jgi:nitroreductase